MTSTRAILLLAALATATACTPKRIPGTELRDTPENRELHSLVERWVDAMNRRDAGAILALVSPDYFDDAGTPEPEDDLDRARLEKALSEDLPRLQASKLAVTLRRIEIEGDAAAIEIFYDSYYRVQTPTGTIPRRDSDLQRLRLRRTERRWLLVSGL